MWRSTDTFLQLISFSRNQKLSTFPKSKKAKGIDFFSLYIYPHPQAPQPAPLCNLSIYQSSFCPPLIAFCLAFSASARPPANPPGAGAFWLDGVAEPLFPFAYALSRGGVSGPGLRAAGLFAGGAGGVGFALAAPLALAEALAAAGAGGGGGRAAAGGGGGGACLTSST